ncbi:hypothetical protein V8C35DRAFT_303158 [Trichoderma chlorosporum]
MSGGMPLFLRISHWITNRCLRLNHGASQFRLTAIMAERPPTETILVKSRRVCQYFADLIALTNRVCVSDSSQLQSSAVMDCLDRFYLWAGNMGAMPQLEPPSSIDQPRLPLDERLIKAVDIREQINQQLDEIIEAIGDC